MPAPVMGCAACTAMVAFASNAPVSQATEAVACGVLHACVRHGAPRVVEALCSEHRAHFDNVYKRMSEAIRAASSGQVLS